MALHTVHFYPAGMETKVRTGVLILEALERAGLSINIPCGGQGRCGRCVVIVEKGEVRRRSTIRVSPQEIAQGYALACQTLVQGDLVVRVPPQEVIERRLPTDRMAAPVTLPFEYDPRDQVIQRYFVDIEPPRLHDNTDDLSRLKLELQKQHGVSQFTTDLTVLRQMPRILRENSWRVTCVLEMEDQGQVRLIDLLPGDQTMASWGAAVDIGTTTITVYLVNLLRGEVVDMAADYNAQISRGEDIISRIVYASKNNGLRELQSLVVETINRLITNMTRRKRIDPAQIHKLTVVGNSTMIHLFLGIPPSSIRMEPYITVANHLPPGRAGELGLAVHHQATVDCLPLVASFMGADITAGVLSSGLWEKEHLTLFLDIGTNGEMVLGNSEFLISCACSAGPAFEGAGVEYGMRATRGAIEEVWINSLTWEPTLRVLGHEKPRGLCGSGLISFLAEMFITGIIDPRGNIRLGLDTPRVRQGQHGGEYVVAWAPETTIGKDIVITQVDIENLLRAKAAVYAGISVLAKSLGIDLRDVQEMLIGGAFGQYLNVEKAIQIGLLPDMPWERFQFLGNTAVRGAYYTLLSREMRRRVEEIAAKMTYLELSADKTFTEEFLAALFLPHTEMDRFPSVKEVVTVGS